MSVRMASDHIRTNIFTDFFKDNIRVRLNWTRFETENWPVTIRVCEAREQLAGFRPPWYISSASEEVSHRDPSAKSICFSELPDCLGSLHADRQNIIRDFSDALKVSRPPVQLIAPAYSTRNVTIILDGNHRIASLFLNDVKFRLMLFVIHGPLDSDALSDLDHWD